MRGLSNLTRRALQYFAGFLASLAFGSRVSETAAENTVEASLDIDANSIIYAVTREFGYVRYDGRKFDKGSRPYRRKLRSLHHAARDVRISRKASRVLRRELAATNEPTLLIPETCRGQGIQVRRIT
jgi:hypothetical protein